MAAAGLRLFGLGWGIPELTPELAAHTPVRSSFHPDEDKTLWQLERMRPSELDLDPKDFGWGTLQTYLVGAGLATGSRTGIFGEGGWLAAFRAARAPFFGRVFVLGRLLAALFGIATVALVYLVARDCGEARAGTLAAAVLAVSPLHLLHSHYLTADVALGFWLLAAAALSLRDRPLAAAFVAGLALATKPSAWVVAPIWWIGPSPRAVLGRAAAFAAGFLIGEPYALLAFREWFAATAEVASGVSAPGRAAVPIARLMLDHGWQVAGYGLGPVAFVAAIVGLRHVPRRLAIPTGLLTLALGFSRFPMSRYVVPLVPFLAIAGGLALARLPRRFRAGACVLALGPSVVSSLGLIGVLRGEHTASGAARWLAAQAPPGARIAQLWDEIPVLDRERHRLERPLDPFAIQGTPYAELASDFVILDDLPIHAWRPELLADLDRNYEMAAVFSAVPRLFGAAVPEPWAAHDWKYTHPTIRIYRRRAP